RPLTASIFWSHRRLFHLVYIFEVGCRDLLCEILPGLTGPIGPVSRAVRCRSVPGFVPFVAVLCRSATPAYLRLFGPVTSGLSTKGAGTVFACEACRRVGSGGRV